MVWAKQKKNKRSCFTQRQKDGECDVNDKSRGVSMEERQKMGCETQTQETQILIAA